MGLTRFRLDSSYRRPADGAVVVAGSPLKLFRLSPGGVRVMRAIEHGDALPSAHASLTERLLDAGAIHPDPASDQASVQVALCDVTIVVPAFGEAPAIPRGCDVIIVDDASEPALTVDDGVRVVRLATNVGPGGARNAGLAGVITPYVAFIDSDVVVTDLRALLDPLLAHFADPKVGAVAPRVVSRGVDDTVLERYESAHSPLDLGGEPARVQAGTRVGYVPAAVLVCRVAALRDVGGFDRTLRYGEDVDLVWRLGEAGWRCRYEPDAVARHRPRATWRAWAAQRMAYGSAAAPLATRHPDAVAPLRISGWSAVVWALAALRRPVLALGVAAGTAVALQRKLNDLPRRESLRLAANGHYFAGHQIASCITRTWWPIAALAALVSRRMRGVVAVAALSQPLIDWAVSRPPIDPVRYTAVRLADDVAYGTGVWRGVVASRNVAALVPSIRNWPPRGAS